MQELDKKKEFDVDNIAKVYSTTLRAGKRTYYLDVKSTLGGEHFLAITESRRKTSEWNEGISNLRQTIYVYPENFEKFAQSIAETLEKIKELKSPMEGVSAGDIITEINGTNSGSLEFELL